MPIKPSTKTCIYCGLLKHENEFSKEHIIPQCIGGAFAPRKFMTDLACKLCNNNLGQFVDASFEKSWIVSNWLSMAARSLYDENQNEGIPLVCMGTRKLGPPDLRNNEVCELWLGPHGEQVYWIRPDDENLYWYTGGNPRTTKSTPTRAYFILSQKTELDPRLTFLSFRDSFRKKKVRKIICTDVLGLDLAKLGFSSPDMLDQLRIDYFREAAVKSDQHCLASFFINYDYRFMCKLALGVGFSVLGESYLTSNYAHELKKGIWHKKGEVQPEIYGASNWTKPDPIFSKIAGLKNFVTLHIIQLETTLVLTLNLGTEHSWQIKCADIPLGIKTEFTGLLVKGETIVLQKYLRKGYSLSFEEFLHKKTATPEELTG